MKIKQDIEWVSGELPETKSLKIVAEVVGGTTIAQIAYYDKNQRCWFRDDARAVHGEVAAWASVPLFQGFPADGQKVEAQNRELLERIKQLEEAGNDLVLWFCQIKPSQLRSAQTSALKQWKDLRGRRNP